MILSQQCTGAGGKRCVDYFRIRMDQALNQNKNWWKKSVIYQIYPRSFCDTNGDGIGDIPGIISKLDHIQALGVDAVWISPMYASPQDDNGYDISDYRDIDPTFGTMDDMRRLLREANKRGIKIIMDMVLNHTSDEHAWFLEAKQSRLSPKHDWYVWRDGVPGTPPNELCSVFGGSAWEWVEECQQYYLHQFSVKQPDLNWDNPEVREALYDMLRWWIDQGAGGFRLDVIDQIAKEPDKMVTAEGSMLHTYIREMSEKVFRGTDVVTVGEAWSANPDTARKWSNPDGSELSMVFQFEHIVLDQLPGQPKWDVGGLKLTDLKRVFGKWQRELNGCGWNSLFWNNHDVPRIVSRWGDDGEYREQSAKLFATVLYGLQGTPYLYQGEELGMTNTRYAIDEYRDIETINMIAERRELGYSDEEILRSIYAKGRDNGRTPMQWDASANAGFTSGEPWLKVNPNYAEINAAEQAERDDSVLSYYRKLIALRKREQVILEGSYEDILFDREDVYAYRRSNGTDELTVVANFTSETVEFPAEVLENAGELELGNYSDAPINGCLRPYEARMYLKKN